MGDLQAEDIRGFMAVVRIPLARPTRWYSLSQEPVTTDNANYRHVIAGVRWRLFQTRTSHSRSAISRTEERILATHPAWGARNMPDDEGIQTVLDGRKVKSYRRGKSEPLC
jgi:hypothetical protein